MNLFSTEQRVDPLPVDSPSESSLINYLMNLLPINLPSELARLNLTKNVVDSLPIVLPSQIADVNLAKTVNDILPVELPSQLISLNLTRNINYLVRMEYQSQLSNMNLTNKVEDFSLLELLLSVIIKIVNNFLEEESSIELPSKNNSVSTKCFEDLGCFESDFFFLSLTKIKLSFSDPKQINTTFNLFTRVNRYHAQVFNYKISDLDISQSLFNGSRPTKFIVHGYMSGLKVAQWMTDLKDILLNENDYNVFAIDWSKGAKSFNYFKCAANTRVVGAMTAYFIKRLVNTTGTKTSDIHCIGHSLGAHICGFIGQRIQYPRLKAITGLDPAGPGFLLNEPNTRLDETDANLVVVIHTNAGIFNPEANNFTTTISAKLTSLLGNNKHLGDFDFWPNGGSSQPVCLNFKLIWKISTCNHQTAYDYILKLQRSECQFIGYQCNTYAEFEEGKCADCGQNQSKCKPMELSIDQSYLDQSFVSFSKTTSSTLSNYYFKTSEVPPFCLFHYQILVKISKNSSPKVSGKIEITLDKTTTVTISQSIKLGLKLDKDIGFKAGKNYTRLFINSKPLQLKNYLRIKWITYSKYMIQIEKISVKYMSHINESIRLNKSLEVCDTNGMNLSNGDSMDFYKC